MEVWSATDEHGNQIKLDMTWEADRKVQWAFMVTKHEQGYGVPYIKLKEQDLRDLQVAVRGELESLRLDPAKLPWSRWWNQCRARKEPNTAGHWGRCELKRGHSGDHILERGMILIGWSTDWTTWTSANF